MGCKGGPFKRQYYSRGVSSLVSSHFDSDSRYVNVEVSYTARMLTSTSTPTDVGVFHSSCGALGGGGFVVKFVILALSYVGVIWFNEACLLLIQVGTACHPN